MPQIACIGEVMIELATSAAQSPGEAELKTLSYAGDTYNTVVTLARLGIDSAYITRLGDDHYSDAIIAKLEAESIATGTIVRHQGTVPGLYMIHNSPDGEREFFYWRNQAPARQLFSHTEEIASLEAALTDTDMLYLSGITLAIINTEARNNLLAFLRRYRAAGGQVAFDSNYRPRLWTSVEEAQKAMLDIMAETDLALLTLDDEELLWGASGDAIEAVKARYSEFAIGEIVLKRGASDVVILEGDTRTEVPVPRVEHIIDTTAAGDTFNAGYLATRLQGQSPTAAAEQANRCASIIIRHRGGVIDSHIFASELARLS
ncbi:MAG TPA: sugar kinase [Cellvibrionaceae bacterium]